MTIEIAAWVLTGCLLACVYFMIVQERRHRKKVIDLEIQNQLLQDRVASLTSLTDDIQAAMRNRQSPANPDVVVQHEEAPRRMRQYVATREFSIGDSGPTIPRGERIEFDGRRCRHGGRTEDMPQLRGAVREGWLVPLEPESRGWGRIAESLRDMTPVLQQFGQQMMGQNLPDDWQERLLRPEAVEGLEPEPRSYEVGDEAVIANGTTYDPGTLIPVEVVAQLPPDHVRKFLDAQLISPSQRDPRPTRYDRLTEDEDD